jgi:hypothetical protein
MRDDDPRSKGIGWLGQIFGTVSEKPGNIAGIAVVASILIIALMIFFGPKGGNVPEGQLYTLFGSIITGALGYLFGKRG